MSRRATCWSVFGCVAALACSTVPGPTTQLSDLGPRPDVVEDLAPPGDEATAADGRAEGDVGVDLPDLAGLDASDLAEVPDLAEVEAGCALDQECVGKVTGLGPCEVARCLSGQCGRRTADDGAACAGGDPCTVGETCKNGQCQGGTARPCDDGKACTVDYCKAGEGCRNDAQAGPCTDGSACTEGDQCVAGECVGTKVDCDDHNPCTVDTCDPFQGCVHQKVLSGACDGPSVCVVDEACVDGQCKGTQVDCDDHNVCTTDTCDPAQGCLHVPTAGKCDDGKACTTDDRCVAGACEGTPIPCDDGDPCTDDTCVEGQGCRHLFNTAACDDLNPCTTGDQCHQGACAGVPVTCPGKANQCDGATLTSYGNPGVCVGGACEYPAQVVSCTQGCANGRCIGDPCEGIACAVAPGACFGPGTCVAGQCAYPYLDAGTPCSDGMACTGPDACVSGVCAGAPVACRDPAANECLDAKTLKAWRKEGACVEPAGTCSYGWDPVECAGGCVDGVCVEALGLLQAELTSGGLLDMSAETRQLSCVVPGWTEPATMKIGTFQVTAGFEP